MASGKSEYLAQKLLDHFFGLATYTFPSTVYISLHTQAYNAGGSATEFTGHNYSRVAVSLNDANWSRASQTVSNDADIEFPVLSGGSQTSLSFGIWDASSGGNLLFGGDLSATFQKAFGAYDQPTFPASALDITFA